MDLQESIWSFSHEIGCHYRFFLFFEEGEDYQREEVYLSWIFLSILMGEEYVEGVNLTAEEFYQKMAQSAELPKTSRSKVLPSG